MIVFSIFFNLVCAVGYAVWAFNGGSEFIAAGAGFHAAMFFMSALEAARD